MPPAVFADTFYWLALARPRDPWHAEATNWLIANPTTLIVTTDEVLTEYLNGLSKAGTTARQYATSMVRGKPSHCRQRFLGITHLGRHRTAVI